MQQKLISAITASGYFRLARYNQSYKEAFKLIKQEKADLILEIPTSFEKDLVHENEATLFIAVNAPVSYLNDVMRMVMLKGSGFRDVASHLLAVALLR